MRAVLQRVLHARVSVEGRPVGTIQGGICAFVGAQRDDTAADAIWLADKAVNARIFVDHEGKMNRSLLDVGGAVLAVSQFTLLGDLRRGNRPSFNNAMDPEPAARLIDEFCRRVEERGVAVQTGQFRAKMLVELGNDGPVTLLLDSKKSF